MVTYSVPTSVISLKDNPNDVLLSLKRYDMLPGVVSGNKFFKFRNNLNYALNNGFKAILSFGGAYSNHIAALAEASHQAGLQSIGIIRGEEHLPLNPTLSFSRSKGMVLAYLSRDKYRKKDYMDVAQPYIEKFGKTFVIPEGGSNRLGIMGASLMLQHMASQYSDIAVPVGSGGTMAGLIYSAGDRIRVHGFSALKGQFLSSSIQRLISTHQLNHDCHWQVHSQFHFGGYGRYSSDLINFINTFKLTYSIPLDPIYTGKMMFGVLALIRQGYFPAKSNILALHTGGLQGIRGFNERFGQLIR